MMTLKLHLHTINVLSSTRKISIASFEDFLIDLLSYRVTFEKRPNKETDILFQIFFFKNCLLYSYVNQFIYSWIS